MYVRCRVGSVSVCVSVLLMSEYGGFVCMRVFACVYCIELSVACSFVCMAVRLCVCMSVCACCE